MSEYSDKLKDPRWKKFRAELIDSRKRRCQRCKVTLAPRDLTVHHGYYRPKGDPWDYERESLWVLCWKCHETTQLELIELHREIATLHPEDLVGFKGKLSDVKCEHIYGLTLEELQDIMKSEKDMSDALYIEYNVHLTACSDNCASRAGEAEDAAHSEFPGLSIDITKIDGEPDCNATVMGPDAEICGKITAWFEKWR